MENQKYGYEAEAVKRQARGAWLEILSRLAPSLDEAVAKSPRHVTCPFPEHGGDKDFRLFKDAAETGGGICTCGTSHDGFELLMRVHGWTFAETLREVGDLIGAPRKEYGNRHNANATQATQTQVILPENLGKPVHTHKGRLVDYGRAPFRFDKKNSASFFVKLEQKSGVVHTLWGVDLEPALQAVNAEKGHVVVLRNHGKQTVKLLIQPTHEGEEVREREAYKNVWRCENLTRPVADDVNHDEPTSDQEEPAPTHGKGQSGNQKPSSSNAQWLEDAKRKAAEREQKRIKNDARIQQAHAELWNQCISTDADMASPVHRYLHSRGINLTLTRKGYLTADNVRFSVSSAYYEEDEEKRHVKIGDFPALVCAVRAPNGDVLTLHRTYLSQTGEKADVESPRKMMPVPRDVKIGGAAIRIGEPLNGFLGVAEGLETALAATQGTGVPCWSTVNATLLAQFEPPKDVHTVVVFADKDRSRTGEIAAAQLQARLETEGIKVVVMLPAQAIPADAKGIDWNDVLVQHGLLGFPCRRRMDQMLKSA